MKIKGRELRQIIREVLSEGAFDSAAYIAGRIEPTYRPEALEPARRRELPPLEDTREARVFSLIVKNISKLLENPDVAFIMQQLNSAARNIASKANSEGPEAAVRSLLASYESWLENPAARRKATRPISGRADLEAYKEELRQQFAASLRRIESMLAPVRGGTFVINKDTGAYELSGMPDFPGRGAEAAFKLRKGRLTGRLDLSRPPEQHDPEEEDLDEARERLTGPPAQVLSVIGAVKPDVAYIDTFFHKELANVMKTKLKTGEDLAKAVEQGLALVWASGMIGGAANPSLTVVPPDANIKKYPYVFTRQDRMTRETEAVVQVGMGPYESGPLIYSNHPSGMLGPEDLARSVTSVTTIDLFSSIDVPHDSGPERALAQGFEHRRTAYGR